MTRHRLLQRRTAMAVAASVWLGIAAGCSTPAPLRFYSLQAPDAVAPVNDHLQPVWIQLGSVGVPVAVDQPEWLVRTPDGSLRLLEQSRWAAPLHEEVRSALLDALQTRWAVSSVNQGVPAKAAVWRVVVDVQRFESLPGIEGRLAARWSIASTSADAKGPVATCAGQWSSGATGDVAALSDAHRANVQQLADAIGSGLQAAAQGTDVRCVVDRSAAATAR